MTLIKDTINNETDRLPNIHPGEILLEDFMQPLGITAYRLSKDTFMSQTQISEIIKGKRSITCDTALQLGKYFNMTPEFWLGLQRDYDLEEELNKIEVKDKLDKIKPCCLV